MMTYEKVKKDMKELWKETFHDSDRYIEIVFDNYFSPQNAFYRYDTNRLIASLLRIPYEFQILTKEGQKRILHGVYLCGLATAPEYRRRGIMGQLMEEAEEASRKAGYEVAFLIPADDHLRGYYERKGYHTSSWRRKEQYSLRPLRPTGKEAEATARELYIYTARDLKERCPQALEKLADWCREIEVSRHNNTILHTRQDMVAVMAENENSIFLSKDAVDPEFPNLTNVVAMVFPELPDVPEAPLRVTGLYYKLQDDQSKDTIDGSNNWDSIKNSEYETNSTRSKKVGHFRCKERRMDVSEVYDAVLKYFQQSMLDLILPYPEGEPEKSEATPYAMLKWLNLEDTDRKIENLRIEISLMLD